MNEYRQKLLKSIGVNYPESTLDNSDWVNISETPNLTDEFIREFSRQLSWFTLSRTQKFSDKILYEFKHKVVWRQYFLFQKPNFQIIIKCITKINFISLNKFDMSYLNKSQLEDIQKIFDLKKSFKC